MLPERENPFATHRVLRERYRLDLAGWAVLDARLRSLGHEGAIVGPQGSGKTTLLEDLAERLAARGWAVTLVRLHAGLREIPEVLRRDMLARLGANDLLLIDGADQLSWWKWRGVRRRARRLGGLIVTLRVPGRMPTLWRCATSPELLRELVQSLGARIAPAEAEALHARHDGNLRAALRELHDRHAEQVS